MATKQTTTLAFRRIVLGLSSASLLFSTTLTPLAAQGGPPGPPGAVAGQTSNMYSAEELDSILAPIALYPDQLLTQILMASAFPDQVGEAAQWVKAGNNRNLRGDALDRALRPLPWDPAVKSLVPFPQALDMLATHGEWMAQLSFAVTEQEALVFDSVQRLRRQARMAGYLRTTSQQVVRTDGDMILIEPVAPNVVYVPVYNPQVVYGAWAYPSYPPYYFAPTYYVPGNILATGIYFGVGAAVVGSLWGWARPRWREQNFYVDPRRYNYFRQNYRAPPGDWRNWDRDQWRPPVRQGEGQARPQPPRPSDDRFRPPIQRPGEGQVRPMPPRPGDGQVGPAPVRPGDGQVRPMPPRPGEGQVRPAPERPGPGDGQVRPMPSRPGDGQVRPMPERPGDGQVRPVPVRPGDGQVRPMPPLPGEGPVRPMPERPGDGQVRPMPPRPGEGQVRPMPVRPNESQIRPAPTRPPENLVRPAPEQPRNNVERPAQHEEVQQPRTPQGGGSDGPGSRGQSDRSR